MSNESFLGRNVVETVGRFRPLLGALGLGTVILLVLAGALGQALSQSATTLDTASALTVLRLDVVNPTGPSKPLTGDALVAIGRMTGVEDVRPYAQFGLALLRDDGRVPDALWATPQVPWVQPRLTRTIAGVPLTHRLGRDEIYLPDTHAGIDDAELLGRPVRIQYTQATGRDEGEARERTVRVIGLFDNSHPGLDGESAAYVGDTLFSDLLHAQLGLPPGTSLPATYGFPAAYVKVTSTRQVAHVQASLVALGHPTDSPTARAQDLPRLLALASRLNVALGGLLLLFTIGIGFSLGGAWSSSRRWDVGVLSSLGWSRGRILRCYTTEIAVVGAAVALFSLTLGCLGSAALGAALKGRVILGATFGPGFALPSMPWLAAVAGGLPLALLLGSAPRVLRLASMPPDLALRRQS